MANRKVDELDRRVPEAYSLKNRVKVAFTLKCKELELSKSRVVENLLIEFLNQNK